MKIYIVYADTYTESYGSEVSLLLVTSSPRRAITKCKELETEHPDWFIQVAETSLDEVNQIYLGGYCE